MANSKIVLADGTVLLDISQDTVAAGSMLSGVTAHDSSGTAVTGTIANGTITNNTSGGTSSGTVNRGSQIKVGAGYYASDLYYTAQGNSGTINIAGAGETSVDGYLSASVPQATGYQANITYDAIASISTNNATVSGSDSSGISITAGGIAYVNAITFAASQAGWFSSVNFPPPQPKDISVDVKYLTGVTLTAPESGTRNFSVTVPNGNTTATFVFNVDASGNVTITES